MEKTQLITDSRSSSQEIPRVLLNPKVHYRGHNSLIPDPILSQRKLDRIPYTISLRHILKLFSHLRLSLPRDRFPSGFPTKILHAFIRSQACYIHRQSHPLLFDCTNI
jgi:hypothetical protein